MNFKCNNLIIDYIMFIQTCLVNYNIKHANNQIIMLHYKQYYILPETPKLPIKVQGIFHIIPEQKYQ